MYCGSSVGMIMVQFEYSLPPGVRSIKSTLSHHFKKQKIRFLSSLPQYSTPHPADTYWARQGPKNRRRNKNKLRLVFRLN